jgi:hypothetical protein
VSTVSRLLIGGRYLTIIGNSEHPWIISVSGKETLERLQIKKINYVVLCKLSRENENIFIIEKINRQD